MNHKSNHLEMNIKYGALQGLYWMIFCSSYSYASVFLLANSFANKKIGLIVATANILAVFLQPTLGSIADKAERFSLKHIISMLLVFSLICLGGTIFFKGQLLLFTVFYTLSTIFILTLQPLVNSLAYLYINRGTKINYGMTRGIGSLTFAITSSILGQLVARVSANLVPIACALFTIMMLILVQTFPNVEKNKHLKPKTSNNDSGLLHMLQKYNGLLILLLGFMSIYIFHTLINTYLVQIMISLGGNDADFGTSMTIAAICELPAMFSFSFLVRKFTSGKLLKFSALVYLIRSILIFLASSVFLVNSTQLLQSLSFAIFTPASVHYMNIFMKDEDKVKGQTLMVGATTLGSVLGSSVGGLILDSFNVHIMLICGIIMALIGCVLLNMSANAKE